MGKVTVITNSELATGFRLAGVEVLRAETAEEARNLLLPLLRQEDISIVAIDDDYLADLKEEERRRLWETQRPLVIGIPTGALAPERSRTDYILELIRWAVGFEVALGRELAEAREE